MPRRNADNEPIVIEATIIDAASDAHDCDNGFGSVEPEGSAASDVKPAIDNEGAKRARGVKQMIAGGAIAAVGVPLLVLPGPGVAAIAGGVALAGKGYQNMTGKDVISAETRNDPEFKEGEEAGERLVERMREFAEEDLAPAGHEITESLKTAAGAAAQGLKAAGAAAADAAGKGFRAAVGEEAANKADGFAQRNVVPAAAKAASFGRGVISSLKPHVAKAANAGSQAAADAVQKLADKTRDMMR